ncbi:NAD(P)/FAD-dependent oxidoreductase [Tomitella biformata]|uniref:NAD(P)/FAD-dependent oxidoreductase n=1 Tax=Tomitella biformata TaxID=630403 RepID=UPI0004642573|nr:FAD-dependent oxidoreductase [Tomitella biformata]
MAVGRIVIVGTGIAGATAAETLRKEGYDGEVVLIGAEPGLPYRRTMASKELLAGDARAELKSAQFWVDAGVDLRSAVEVTAIDPAARVVATDDGQTLTYDALLLATGGRPRELALAPAGVHYLRTMGDAEKLRDSLAAAHSVLIVGGGLIGCEVAAAAAAGRAVTLLEAGGSILERVLPPQVSAMLAGLHEANGVDVQTGVALTGIERGPDGLTAIAADGRSWTADAVVVAVGMAPNTELAQAAGLEVADGIVVDEFCATSAPGIFAAGDVARLPNPIIGGSHRVEHWNHAQAHGAAAARAMLGLGAAYADVPWCWTTQYGKNVQITGWPGAAQEWAVDGSVAGHDFTALATRAGAPIGAVSLGRPKDVRAARAEIAAAHAAVSRV